MKGLILIMAFASAAFGINYHGCTLAPDNLHGWVVCSDTVLILHTTDGGMSWVPQEAPLDTNPRRFADVTCTDDSNAYVTGLHALWAGEILQTTDGGDNWYTQITGFAKNGTRVEFIDQNHGWAVGGDGCLARTTDGGGYWEQVNTDWWTAEYYGVSFVNQWDGWICAGWPDSVTQGQGYICSSNDGGIIWDTLDGYHAAGYEDFFDIHFFNVNEGIVVGGYDSTYAPIVWKTTNGGDNWNPISVPPNAYYLRALDFVELEGWAVGKSGTIIHTTDAGNTWTTQSSPSDSTLFDVDFIDHLNGLACGYDHILRTTNGGQNWLSVGIQEYNSTVPTGNALTVSPNPFSQSTRIDYGAVQSPTRTEINIYDACGRLVRSFYPVPIIQSQESAVLWDGTNNQGARVPPGIYFVRFCTSEQTSSEKLVLLE